MKQLKLIIQMLFIFLVSACNNNDQSTTIKNTNNKTSADSLDIQGGKKWLKESIESFFNDEENFMKGFSLMCTEQYSEFKQDATNIDFDGGMSEEAFKKKWGHRYSKYAGLRDGFMISGNDFGKIELVKIEFKHKTEIGGLLYDIVIVDKTYNSKFIRQVAIVKTKNSFLIDNVFEISNEFNTN